MNRVYRYVENHCQDLPVHENAIPDGLNENSRKLHRKTHQTIRKVTQDLESNFHFNTAISAIMELVNMMIGLSSEESQSDIHPLVIKEAITTTLTLLYPMTPHFCSEFWGKTGNSSTLEDVCWPSYDKQAAKEDEITVVLQVNGKVRSRLQVDPTIEDEALKEMAMLDDKVQKFVAGKPVRKIIVVPKKLVNVVV